MGSGDSGRETPPSISVLYVGPPGGSERLMAGEAGDRLAVETEPEPGAAAGRIERGAFDCVVLDHAAASVDGMGAVGACAGAGDVPVVVCTGDGETAERALRAGATDVWRADVCTPGVLARRVSNAAVAGPWPPDSEARDPLDSELRLTSLLHTTRSLMEAETRDEVMTVASTAATEVLDFPGTGVRRYDPDSEALVQVSMGGTVDDDIERRPPYPVDDSPHGRAFRKGTTVVEDIGDDDPYDREVFSQTMYVPIGDHGVLSAGITGGEFEDAEIQLAELLAASAEAALTRAERREELTHYREVLKAAAGMVYALDRQGRFTLVSEPMVDRFGHDRETLFDAHASLIFPAEEVQRGRDAIGGLLDSGEESTTLKADAVTADGERFPVEIEIGLLPAGDDESFAGTVGVVRDITELERTRERLRSQRDRYTQLLETIPDAVVETEFVDGDPIVRTINPAFETLFGYDRGEIVGDSLNEYVVPPDREHEGEEIDERIVEGDPVNREVRRSTADGERYFLFRSVPYQQGDSKRGIGIYTDITDRKRREQYLQVISRVLRHNLRNDLNVVMGFADQLADAVDEPPKSTFADKVVETADEVTTLSEKAREIQSVVRAGPIESERIDVAAIVRSVVEDYPAEGAEIETDLPDSLIALAGPRLDTVVENLVDNAIVHNPGEQKRVRVSTWNPDAGWVEARVADNGTGVPEHERAIITEDREISQLEHASGLGLWLVKWIVEGYGGRVRFEDSEWGGTTVVLRFRQTDE